MSSSTMSAEQREFVQFCKYFAIRTVQIIVQSRLGRKIRTPCRVLGQRHDWFNLNVEEIPEVNAQLNRSLNGVYPPTLDSVNVLISLRTSDGESLHLEIWRLSLESSAEQQTSVAASENTRTQLYHRMSIMMRSVVAATRTTPAYKLYARRQGPESFVFCYEISSGPAKYQALLGDQAKTAELGYVVSPFGTIKLTLHYRTKMVIDDSAAKSTISQSVDENYYDPMNDQSKRRNTTADIYPATTARDENQQSSAGSSHSLPRHYQHKKHASVVSVVNQQPVLQEIGPWQPLAEPSPSKVSPLPDFSPCFSTFSTSPGSADFNPYSPLFNRKPSVVAFQVGATSCSSSEDGGSSHHLHSSGAVIPFGLIQSGVPPSTPKRNSSSGIFPLDISESGGTSGVVAKPSSVPDCFGRGRSLFSTAKRADSFPFARLLSSCSAPAFGGSSSAVATIPGGAFQRGSQPLFNQTKRQVIEEEKFVGDELDLNDSREITMTDGVKIYEKRKKRNVRKKKRNVGNAAECLPTTANEDDEDESSSDDSFVRIEIRPAFAPSRTTAGDASAFLSECKLAPAQLKSFAVAGPTRQSPSDVESHRRRSCSSLEQIPVQLKDFEEKQKQFDDFVKSLLNERLDEASSEGETEDS